jgi:hypothetical protein
MSEDRGQVVQFPQNTQTGWAGSLAGQGLGAVGGTAVAVQLNDELEVQVVPNEDGGSDVVVVTAPAVHTYDDDDQQFEANLADIGFPASILANVADDALQGLETDEGSRAELIQQWNEGIDLLGLKLEEISASQGQKRGISRVGHPLLKESLIKYVASATGELLPAAGPAKVSTVGQVASEEEERAQDFADAMNFFLTDIATEFYRDTQKMFVHQGYGGNAYKKIFRCAMRNRPVSEFVSMIDLIVSEEAKDLETALRVTHQFFPSRAEVRRMQIMGRYRDFPIPHATGQLPSANRAVKSSEGLSASATRPQDVPLRMVEMDLDLDPEMYPELGLAKYERAAPVGLPLPYKVTIDRDSRQIFGLWRNWDPEDELYRKDNMYVRYGFMPGLGFHDWGYLQILGDYTRAQRAIWRLLIDSGMFNNFPAWIKIKGTRTSTNEIAPGPGEAVDLDVPGATDIRQMIMALPTKQLDAVFVQFLQYIGEQSEKLGGTVMIETGEGRTNVPVGTVMSQIEQSTQIMAFIHKGNHTSQKHELMKLRKLFAKNPADITRLNPNPSRQWLDPADFMDLNLSPASDPNIPAHVHRIMQAWALLMLVQQAPGQFDIQECLRRALSAIRIADPKTLLLSPEQLAAAAQSQQEAAAAANQKPPDPTKVQAAQVNAQAKTQQTAMQHQGKMTELAADAQNKQGELNVKAQAAALESADKAADRQAELQGEAMRLQAQREKMQSDAMKANAPGADNPEGGTAFDAIV